MRWAAGAVLGLLGAALFLAGCSSAGPSGAPTPTRRTHCERCADDRARSRAVHPRPRREPATDRCCARPVADAAARVRRAAGRCGFGRRGIAVPRAG